MTREKRAIRKGESEQVGGMNVLFMLGELASCAKPVRKSE